VAMALGKLYPGQIAWDASKALIGSSGVIGALDSGADAAGPAKKGVEEFEKVRQKYLLYR